jgi:hypothetical protein
MSEGGRGDQGANDLAASGEAGETRKGSRYPGRVVRVVRIAEGCRGWQVPTEVIDGQSPGDVQRVVGGDEENRSVHRTPQDRQALVAAVEVGVWRVLAKTQPQIQSVIECLPGAFEEHVVELHQNQGFGPVCVLSRLDN